MVYSEDIYKKKIVNKKIDERSLIIFQKNLKINTKVKITNILNKDKVKTKLGGIWYRQSVKNVLDTNLNEYIG